MLNHIEKIRADVQKDLNAATFTKGDAETSFSPTKNFRLIATNYGSKELNLDLTKVELFSEFTGEKLFDFFTNDGQFFFGWLKKKNSEYFICSEDLFGGQTVVDLTNKAIASYSPNIDGFIWTDFHLSPDGKKLATIGCHWACSFVIKVYDFTEPMSLPLKEINEIDLIGNDEIITGWQDNETLNTKGFERTYGRTVNGDYTGKVLTQTPVQRVLKITPHSK